MRYTKVSLDTSLKHTIPYYDFDFSENNTAEVNQMKELLKTAIREELTERQRYCLSEYFFEGKKMKAIAQDLNINPSTVTRHIKKAVTKLKHIAKIYTTSLDI
jgi:RNA polymerase sigma factor (sigma-70 family)